MISAGCAVAADTKLETPEGPMAIRAAAGKAIAVFTRDPRGRTRFRMMHDVRRVAEQQPVLAIKLENGAVFRVGPEQVLYVAGMIERRADALHAGDALEPIFHYPTDYQYRDDIHGGERTSTASLRIVALETGGAADLYALRVHPTGCFFVTAGVLCKADGA